MIRRDFWLHFIILVTIEYAFADVYVYDLANKLVDQYDDQAANFGPSLSSDGLKGYLLTTNPPNACKSVSSTPTNVTLPDGFQWIALIPRTKGNDTCDFDLKVFNAQQANFSAVIVYNYEDQTIPMGPHGRSIKIPSSMISFNDGKMLLNNYLYNFSAPVNSTPHYHIKLLAEDPFRIGAYFIPFAVVISVMVFGLIILMVIKCLLQRRRTRRHRLPRSALKQLKTKKFVKGDRWEVCAICLDDYVDGAKLRILPCDHAYHMKCIDPWLLNSRRQCPVCKRYVFPNLDHSDEESTNTQVQQPARTTTSDERTPLLLAAVHENEFQGAATNSLNRIDESSDSDDPFATTTISRTRRPLFARLPARRSTTTSNENSTSITTYGTGGDLLNNERSANFFVGSISGATDNTNVSAQSMTDGHSDIETIDDDDDDDDDDESEQMHSVLASSESNPAYVNDDESS